MNEWIISTVEQLRRGAFLVVKGNPMTIGWAQFGIIWGKLCCTVYVRKSRYTHELMEQTSDFVISVPELNGFRDELAVCGSKSGRDTDKLKLCRLELSDEFGGIKGCRTHLKCHTLYSYDFTPQNMDEEVLTRYYEDLDMHTAYVAQIVEVREEQA